MPFFVYLCQKVNLCKDLRHFCFHHLSDKCCPDATRTAPRRRLICCKYAATCCVYAATQTHQGCGFPAILDRWAGFEFPSLDPAVQCACTASSSSSLHEQGRHGLYRLQPFRRKELQELLDSVAGSVLGNSKQPSQPVYPHETSFFFTAAGGRCGEIRLSQLT